MSLPPSRPDARRSPRLAGGRVARFLDRLVKKLSTRRHGVCSCQASRPSEVVRPPTADHRLARLDDPAGGATVLALRGMVHPASLAALRDELDTLGAPHSIYLDFHEAIIASKAGMEQLARLIDEVELAGLDVRVVGISPDHPALPQARPAD